VTPKTVTFTGSGGAVPENVTAGADFDITVSSPDVILGTGDNVKLTLIGVNTPAEYRWPNPYGGLVNFSATLQHVGYGAPSAALSNPLDASSYICTAGLDGNYSFLSGTSATVPNGCGSGPVPSENALLAPGTYETADPSFSSTWNDEPVAGMWQLNVQEIDINTGAGQFLMNSTWTWKITVKVQTPTTLRASASVSPWKVVDGLIVFSATLTASGQGVSDQTVTFSLNNVPVGGSCTAVTGSSGVATCDLVVKPLSAVLGHGFAASFGGNSGDEPSTTTGTVHS
jgi:hypothetical protein